MRELISLFKMFTGKVSLSLLVSNSATRKQYMYQIVLLIHLLAKLLSLLAIIQRFLCH